MRIRIWSRIQVIDPFQPDLGCLCKRANGKKFKFLRMNRFIFLLMVCSLFGCRPGDKTTSAINEERSIGIENSKIALVFDKKTGVLTQLTNKITMDNYLKNPKGGNIFRLFVNTTSMPVLSAGPHNDNYGGSMIDPSTCVVEDFSYARKAEAGVLTLRIRPEKLSLNVVVTIVLPDTADFFDCRLAIANHSDTSYGVYASFPYFSGISLGQEPQTNLAVNMWDRGYPGIKAWEKNSGGLYGREVSMQWQCVYDTAIKEGLAFITMDTAFKNKILTCFAGGGMQSLYFDKEVIEQGTTGEWPAARVVVFNGNWRTAARDYHAWATKYLHFRPLAGRYTKDVAIRSSVWLPTKETVQKQKQMKNPQQVTSFRQLMKLYEGGYADCLEIAQWNEGVNLWPETYGPWMSSGFLDFRSDMGGRQAFEEGVKNVHRFGRKVAMYLAGYGIRTSSPLFKNSDWKNWAIMNAKGDIDFDYRDYTRKDGAIYGINACPGYKPWQDHIIGVCTMLAKAGVDEIRLDEIGFPFKPCFNPAHHHRSPYNCNLWMREFLRRIREAVDKINPQMVISTENFMDYFHTYTDGALVMDCSGKEIDAMKIAMPSYLPMSYHASSAEAAITGAIMSKLESHRQNWAWDNVGTERPDDYPSGEGVRLPWYELYPTFADALTKGDITEWDPLATNDSKWMGHLWKDSHYWVLTGGHDDATPLAASEIEVKLPELPQQVTYAFEYNVETLEMKEIVICRSDKGIFIKLHYPVSAVFFPLPSCPPLPVINSSEIAGSFPSTIAINVTLFAPWNPESERKNISSIAIRAPGFKVKKKSVNGNEVLLDLDISASIKSNNYFFQVEGNCLPVKRWFLVK